jgi:hypothetical protein
MNTQATTTPATRVGESFVLTMLKWIALGVMSLLLLYVKGLAFIMKAAIRAIKPTSTQKTTQE